MSRHHARTQALQILFSRNFLTDMPVEELIETWQSAFSVADALSDSLTERLVTGVANNPHLDDVVGASSENWRIDRMPIVDRTILRCGAFELLFCDDIPAIVTINEWIEIAREYSGDESAKFVNGVLDKVKDRIDSPLKTP